MRAAVVTAYGSPDVVQIKDVPQPVPADDQILVKVQAAALNFLDMSKYGGPVFVRLLSKNGLRTPKDQRLGVDLAGRVEAIGQAVTTFRPGDEVFGLGDGAFAEYAVVRESHAAAKPGALPFEGAAAAGVAGLTALQGLRDAGQIQAGQRVLIYGAGGGVGTFAVQIAKSFGTQVTAVCGPQNIEVLRSIGADHVIDYTRSDFSKAGQHYDLIFAVNGYRPISVFRTALSPAGRFVLVGASKAQIIPALLQALVIGPVLSALGTRKLGFMGVTKTTREDLLALKALLDTGKVTPVIDKRYTLDELPAALWYLEAGHARGKIVITMAASAR